jgi:hypothetical protein
MFRSAGPSPRPAIAAVGLGPAAPPACVPCSRVTNLARRMAVIKLVVAYDGTGFHGWARQRGGPSDRSSDRLTYDLSLGHAPLPRLPRHRLLQFDRQIQGGLVHTIYGTTAGASNRPTRRPHGTLADGAAGMAPRRPRGAGRVRRSGTSGLSEAKRSEGSVPRSRARPQLPRSTTPGMGLRAEAESRRASPKGEGDRAQPERVPSERQRASWAVTPGPRSARCGPWGPRRPGAAPA